MIGHGAAAGAAMSGGAMISHGAAAGAPMSGGAMISHGAAAGGAMSGGAVMSRSGPVAAVGGGAVSGGLARGNMIATGPGWGFHHDHFDHDHHRFFRFHRFFPAFALGYSYSDYEYPSYEDCYVVQRVWTHYGWRLRRVWVCG
jgi:hypothetical protein